MKDPKKFRILSIDGGGYKGLYSSLVISEIEKRFGKICDVFDMICGTSTGGIIALGLSLGRSADEIVEYYIKEGPKIFPSESAIVRWLHLLRQFTILPKYSQYELKASLQHFFQDAQMKDAKCHLCIPSVSLSSANGIIFKSNHSPEFIRDPNLRMIDVALATSAAPTFFPSAIIKDVSLGLVDGGLWANNPALIGAVEAMSYFVGDDKTYKNFSILSISSISKTKSWFPRNHKNASIINWGNKLFPLTITVQSNAMDNLLKIISKKQLFPLGDYIRIEEPNVSPNQMNNINLDLASKKAIRCLQDLAYSTINTQLNRNDVINFFE